LRRKDNNRSSRCYIIVVLNKPDEVPDKEYHEKLREIWKTAPKLGFEPHGFSSVFVGSKKSFDVFEAFVESYGLKCSVIYEEKPT